MRRALFAALLLAGCGGGGTAVVAVQLGGPNPGLSAGEIATFERGLDVFEHRFTLEEGHGPDFNTSSCKSCHEIPVAGGSSGLYRNFFLAGFLQGGSFSPAFENDQFVARTFSYERLMREAIPASALIAQRNAPPMFGVGLFERIPDSVIAGNQDPVDLDGDGISGRVNIDGIRIGRFGFKAQEGDLVDFIRSPMFNHMGITSNPPSAAQQAGLSAEPQIVIPGQPLTDDDGVPDPELLPEDLDDLILYVRELAPPAPLAMDATARRGEALFDEIGCARCHIPNLATADEPILAYTDLLLHDMGPELADGIPMGSATGSEFRTQPLWGVRLHAPYLHDGRVGTLDEAIRLHGGEAAAIRNAYVALPAGDRDAILAFLETR